MGLPTSSVPGLPLSPLNQGKVGVWLAHQSDQSGHTIADVRTLPDDTREREKRGSSRLLLSLRAALQVWASGRDALTTGG